MDFGSLYDAFQAMAKAGLSVEVDQVTSEVVGFLPPGLPGL